VKKCAEGPAATVEGDMCRVASTVAYVHASVILTWSFTRVSV
jgi:hypothetical protein